MDWKILPQLVIAIGALGTAAFGLVEASKAVFTFINNIGFGRIKKTVQALTPGRAANALSQGHIVETLHSNWINGTDLSSQKAIAKSLIKLNLSPGNAPAVAAETGVDPAVLTAVATSIAAGTPPLTPAQTDLYGRFDLIVTALLDETYQRSDNVYRNWTRAIAAGVAVALAIVGGLTLQPGPTILQSVIVGLLATPLAPIAKDLSTALATAVNTMQAVKKAIDVRLDAVGGNLATSVAINRGTSINNYQGLDIKQLLSDIRGQHVLIGTHGYDVDRESGIAGLSNWEGLLQLPSPSVFVGLLWPGDSIWAHGLDYPEEPKVANEAGELIAPFLDDNFKNAASVSFASHSLGARVVLQTVSKMGLPVRRVTLMAGAIDDNCLTSEFKTAAGRVEKISVLASKKDEVLSTLFPLGNLIGGIIAEGHPWWHAALGHCGPSKPRPVNFQSPFEIPANWDYGHHNYLQIDAPPLVSISLPTDVPVDGSSEPAGGVPGWQEAWSAAFCATRFQ